MTDPRPELRTALARWLQLRARVRALAHALVASEHAMQRDARRRGDEPELAVLAAQLRDERTALDALGGELDDRIAAVKRDVTAIEAAFVGQLRAQARHGSPDLEAPS